MDARSVLKTLFSLVACAGVAVAIAYLAGLLYFLVNKVMPDHIAWNTWWRYWQAYGTDSIQRPRLIGSGIVAAIAVGLGGLFLVMQACAKQRPLHGAARWATEAEIRAAGLL
jgi:type IV secretion system protein VirD4